MKAPFPLLGDADYVTYIGPIAHRGANTTTHLAEIRYPVQAAPIISVVKLLPPDGLAACNEAMAWLFLRSAGVPTPRNAAIMTMSESKAVKVLGRKAIHKSLVHEGTVLAWAARKLDFQSIRALFSGTVGDEKWLALLRTVEGAAIAAFDETFLNIDRNGGNVLYTSASTCTPIDHEMAFGYQNWKHAALLHLPQDGDSLRTIKHAHSTGRLTPHAYREALNRMVFHAEKHGDALQACSSHITHLLERIHPGQAEQMAGRVLSFVAARTAQQWIKERLGVM